MNISEEIRNMKANLFATANSIDEVVEASSDSLSVMITVNTTLELVARHFDKELNFLQDYSLASYIADYINEELTRKPLSHTDEFKVQNAIDAYLGGAR